MAPQVLEQVGLQTHPTACKQKHYGVQHRVLPELSNRACRQVVQVITRKVTLSSGGIKAHDCCRQQEEDEFPQHVQQSLLGKHKHILCAS